MGKSDGKVTISTALDNKGLEKGIGNISGSLGGLKSVVGKLGGAIAAAFSIKAIVDFSKKAIELGSDLEEVQNVVDVSFGSMKAAAEDFAATAVTKFGMSELAAKRTASTYMAMAKGLGVAENAASDMAISLAGLSGDVASFYNLDQEVAAKKLQGVFTGESEALKELGVVMTQTNLKQFALAKGMNANVEAMSQAELVSLRYAFVTDALSLAAGDFVRTQDSWANQTRILSMQWQQFMGIIGQSLTTVLTPAIQLLNNLVSVLITAAQKIQAVVSALFGKTAEQTQAVAESASAGAAAQEDLADGVTKAGKAAKKSLASFDELNTLQNNSNSTGNTATSTDIFTGNTIAGSANTGVISTAETAIQSFVAKIQEIIAPLKNIDFSSAIKAFKELGKPIKKLGKIIGENLEWYWFNIFVPLSTFMIEDVLPRFFEALASALSILGAVLDGCIGVLKQFYDEFLIPIAKYTGEKFLKFADQTSRKLSEIEKTLRESSVWEDLKTILSEIYEVLEPFCKYLIDLVFWLGNLVLSSEWQRAKMVFAALEDTLGYLAALIHGDFDDAWQHLKDLMWNNNVEVAKENVDNLKTSIGDLIAIVSDFAKTWKEKLKEIVDEWSKKISAWWTENVEPWFTVEKWESVIQGMVDAFAICWNKVYDFFAEAVPQWWDDNIAPWFTKEKWEELIDIAVEGVKSGWKGFNNFFSDTLPKWWKDNIEPWFTKEKWKELGEKAIEGLVNPIIDGLNSLIEKLNKFSIEIPEIKGITEGFTLGFDIPKIPKLAQGAVLPANKPFLAMVGDQKHGTNIEAPLDTIKQALAEVMETQGCGDITINFTGDLAQLARVLNPVIEIEGRRVGGSLVRKAGT